MRKAIKALSLLLASLSCFTACDKSSEINDTISVSEYEKSSFIETISDPITANISDDVSVSAEEITQDYELITIEPECGPSIELSFGLPTGWKYECVMTEDEPTSCITATLWADEDSDTDNGKLRIEYSESGYSVCGTFLEEKSIDFNGCPASQGFYDNSNVWSFIILDGEYYGCGIFNELTDYEKYSDCVDIVLSTIEFKKYAGEK
ncbi:MAG: hypothetical protein SOT68_12350 [Oscillospiraceae bacterium]|nr:hypothetical protein [Oscillospiraceae bacterium]MDD7279840.1 hypothetical protein [Oscillospiraceae bacterium]MDY2864962.1 hypothetical protein [Oscillospiraceae bacterium]